MLFHQIFLSSFIILYRFLQKHILKIKKVHIPKELMYYYGIEGMWLAMKSTMHVSSYFGIRQLDEALSKLFQDEVS